MTLQSPKLILQILAVIVFGSFPFSANGQGYIEIVARSGNAPPEGNGVFSTFAQQPPVLNNAGQTAFQAGLSGTNGGTEDDLGIYRSEASIGQLVLVLREKGRTPNSTGFSALGRPAINDNGELAFLATRLQPFNLGGADFGTIYRGAEGAPLTSIVAVGTEAPDGNGIFDGFLTEPKLNDSGQSMFVGSLTNTAGGMNDNHGIFLGSGGNVTQIARAGGTAPDGNGVFSGLTNEPALNASGQVAFAGLLTGTSGTNDNVGIFLGSGGALTQIARTGDSTPDGNGVFLQLGLPALNESGQSAFTAILNDTSGGSNDDEGIYVGSGGAVTQIARAGDEAPDGNGVFSSFVIPALNASGQTAFRATLTDTSGGPNDAEGIFVSSRGDVTQIARTGVTSPDGNGVLSNLGPPALNASGEVAYGALFDETVGDASDNFGIFLANRVEKVQIAREGQTLAGGTITSLTLSIIAGGGRSGLNDRGQVAFLATLDNGDDLIVRYTIPDLHWTANGSGFWTTPANWTRSIEPNSFHDMFIDPDSGVVVTGNSQNSFVKSLSIGATNSGEAVLRLDNGGDLEALEGITINDRGRIDVGSGRVLTAQTLSNSGVLSGDGQIDAVLTNHTIGEVRVGNGDHLRVTGNGSHTNDGVIEVIDGTVEFSNLLVNTASTGLVTGRNGTFRFQGGLTNTGAVTVSTGISDLHGAIANTGSMIVSGNATATFYGDVSNSGTVNVSTGSTGVFFGKLSGNGVGGAGTVFLEGDIRPGASPGQMAFGGNLSLGPFSNLHVEIAGTTPGDEHDQINITGTTTINGTLDIIPDDGSYSDPSSRGDNDVFVILAAGDLAGSFQSVNYDRDELVPTIVGVDGSFRTHVGDGLFRNLMHTDTSVQLINYLAVPGDANGDLVVDDLDFQIWNAHKFSGGTNWTSGDFNDDGFTDVSDFNLWNDNRGFQATMQSVPEPTTSVLVLFGLATVLVSCRRGRIARLSLCPCDA